MTPEAALEASIAHWAQNMRAQTPEAARIGSDDDPLCRSFHRTGCRGCPVRLATGSINCRNTPFADVANALLWWSRSPTPENRAAFIAAATKMHDWLVQETTA